MGIPVKLQVFEGPLDLLLHLIDRNKIDIYDIPIVEITHQYMAYIHAMEEADLNVMSEFLVMAATLLDIKCRMLLPRQVNEEGEEIDPREELKQQLLQYKICKYMAQGLGEMEKGAAGVYYRRPSLPREVLEYRQPPDLEALLSGVTLEGLQDVFHDVMRRKEGKVDPIRSRFGTIEKEKVSLSERLLTVGGYARKHRRFSFRRLLEEQAGRTQVVITFLAVLELVRTGEIEVRQEEPFGEIYIHAREEAV